MQSGQEQGNYPLRLEVSRLKYFKFTKSWTVKVEDHVSETEAHKLVAASPDKYLDRLGICILRLL